MHTSYLNHDAVIVGHEPNDAILIPDCSLAASFLSLLGDEGGVRLRSDAPQTQRLRRVVLPQCQMSMGSDLETMVDANVAGQDVYVSIHPMHCSGVFVVDHARGSGTIGVVRTLRPHAYGYLANDKTYYYFKFWPLKAGRSESTEDALKWLVSQYTSHATIVPELPLPGFWQHGEGSAHLVTCDVRAGQEPYTTIEVEKCARRWGWRPWIGQ